MKRKARIGHPEAPRASLWGKIMVMKISAAVGVCAYNEEQNIGRLLQRLCQEEVTCAELRRIVVIASGCTDGTEEIVRSWESKDRRVRLLRQLVREGKASAINSFLKETSEEVVVLESADTVPEQGALERLLAPFEDARVGAVGSRVVPLGSRKGMVGSYVEFFWRLHHEVATEFPKCGELLAFRNVLPQIARDTATDETWIIALLLQMGYEVRYAPEAVVYNRGPETFRDLCLQRKRQVIGYFHLRERIGFTPKTMDPFYVTKKALKLDIERRKRLRLPVVALMEGLFRLVAWYSFYLKRENPYIWHMAGSTKRLPEVGGGAMAPAGRAAGGR